MGESGIGKYGSIWWELGRGSENRKGYCENAYISFSSNVVGSRKRGLAIKAWKRNSKFLSFPPQGGI